MRQSLRVSLAGLDTAALSIASLPAVSSKPYQVGQGSARDLRVMSIQLKDIVKPQVGVQGQMQAASTPNQGGHVGFLQLVFGKKIFFIANTQPNAHFSDSNDSSSIINTTVAGTTVRSSSKLIDLGLNSLLSWMHEINAGYETRPMGTGQMLSSYGLN